MERRDFIKTTCNSCLLLGAGLWMQSLSSCAPIAIYKTEITNNKITVPVALFDKSDLQIVSVKSLKHDIALRKEKNGNYIALLLQCTHANNGLLKTGNGYACSLHGSTFDYSGRGTKGPAEQPLINYPVQISNEQIIISLT